MQRFIALLRGINVSGQNKIPMAELRAVCATMGWENVQSYIQSGNLIFYAETTVAEQEADLEAAIAQHFGLTIRVIVRAAAHWPAYVQSNPFPAAAEATPNLLMLALAKRQPKPDAVAGLQERAAAGEQIAQVGDALWIHYPAGAGRSKLSPALFDRLVGSPVTSRNWRTVLKLHALSSV